MPPQIQVASKATKTLSVDKSVPIIDVRDIYKTYYIKRDHFQQSKEQSSSINALNGVNFQIMPSEFVSIIGKSGSGKSTLMNILGCLDLPSKGDYHLHGKNISAYSEKEISQIRNKEIGFIFQGFNLIPELNALENVELPLMYRGISKSERRKISLESLARVGLSDRIRHRPSEMSGGQQQRVAIARAITAKPPIILADEPTGNLDKVSGGEIINILFELNKEGHTIILITHDDEISTKAQRIIQLKDGEIEKEIHLTRNMNVAVH